MVPAGPLRPYTPAAAGTGRSSLPLRSRRGLSSLLRPDRGLSLPLLSSVRCRPSSRPTPAGLSVTAPPVLRSVSLSLPIIVVRSASLLAPAAVAVGAAPVSTSIDTLSWVPEKGDFITRIIKQYSLQAFKQTTSYHIRTKIKMKERVMQAIKHTYTQKARNRDVNDNLTAQHKKGLNEISLRSHCLISRLNSNEIRQHTVTY